MEQMRLGKTGLTVPALGFGGIPIQRHLAPGSPVILIRPLLHCSRGEIEDYVRQNKIPFRDEGATLLSRSGSELDQMIGRAHRLSVVLDDDTGRMEVSFFSEAFQEFRDLLVKDEIVVVTGALRYDDFIGSWTVNAKNVLHIDRVIESRASGLVLSLAPNGQGEQLLVKLHDVLLPFREGSCDVSVRYIGDNASARLSLGPEWAVRPSRELRDKLTELLGSNNVRLLYTPGRNLN